MEKCKFCGAEVPDGSNFCTECGKPIPQGNVCPHCGAPINDGDVFCQECGKRIDENLSSAEPIQGHCPQCGADVSDGDAFCQNCGHRFIPNEESSDSTGYENDNEEAIGEVVNTSKSKFTMPIILGIIVLALLGGWYFFGFNSSEDDNDTQPLVTDSISVGSDTTEDDAMSPEQVIEAKKQFLESFYKKYDSLDEYDEAFIKSIVTNNALQILKKHYTRGEGGDTSDPNGLACWLFNYYNGWVACGSVISRNITSKGGDIFVVSAKYEDVEKYEVELSVIKDGDSYKIDDIYPIGSDMSDDEIEIKSQEELARTNTAIGAFDVKGEDNDSIQ